MELRRVKLYALCLFGILEISHYHGISHDDRAYMYASLLFEFRRHMHYKGHKYSVSLSLNQLSDMPVHQLCREAYRIRCYILQSRLILRLPAVAREFELIS